MQSIVEIFVNVKEKKVTAKKQKRGQIYFWIKGVGDK
jgi:hypothetical protein